VEPRSRYSRKEAVRMRSSYFAFNVALLGVSQCAPDWFPRPDLFHCAIEMFLKPRCEIAPLVKAIFGQEQDEPKVLHEPIP
jgi:hypothetical protein